MARKKNRPAQPAVPTPQETALERVAPLLSAEELAALVAELENPLPTAFRINTLKIEPERALAEWPRRYSWQLKPVPYSANGWQVIDAETPPSQTIEHRMGFYYIQDAASMLPPEMFDFGSLGERPLILDMAASPGGKTTHLISLTGDKGLVLANDASASRLTALRIVLNNWGAINTAAVNFQGEKLGGWFPETFDAILLDAPCSMQNLRSTETHPMRPISDKEHQRLSQRQSSLLESAFLALKPGGQVVYSTCTLMPEEDEAVVDSLIRRFPGLVVVEDAAAKLGISAPGLESAGSEVFDPAVTRSLRLWPHRYGTSGFFAARITKTGAAPARPGTPPPSRPFEKTGLARLGRRELAELSAYLSNFYGFDLEELIERQQIGLWQREGTVFAIPDAYLSQFAGLPYHTLGLLAGEYTPDGFAISHEWATRFGQQFTRGIYHIPDEQISVWLTGQDLREALPEDAPKGSILVVFDSQERNLGRARVLKDRMKNLLPRRVV